jgi:hypothetical protein
MIRMSNLHLILTLVTPLLPLTLTLTLLPLPRLALILSALLSQFILTFTIGLAFAATALPITATLLTALT